MLHSTTIFLSFYFSFSCFEEGNFARSVDSDGTEREFSSPCANLIKLSGLQFSSDTLSDLLSKQGVSEIDIAIEQVPMEQPLDSGILCFCLYRWNVSINADCGTVRLTCKTDLETNAIDAVKLASYSAIQFITTL